MTQTDAHGRGRGRGSDTPASMAGLFLIPCYRICRQYTRSPGRREYQYRVCSMLFFMIFEKSHHAMCSQKIMTCPANGADSAAALRQSGF